MYLAGTYWILGGVYKTNIMNLMGGLTAPAPGTAFAHRLFWLLTYVYVFDCSLTIIISIIIIMFVLNAINISTTTINIDNHSKQLNVLLLTIILVCYY